MQRSKDRHRHGMAPNPAQDPAPSLYAHSRNDEGKRHDLVDHLRSVAALAAEFATLFSASDLAHSLGLWHDVGKFDPDFQSYLLQAESGKRSRGADHKAAGVHIALEQGLGPFALVLQGHHGGLKNKQDLKRWFDSHSAATNTALERAQAAIPDLLPASPVTVPESARPQPDVRQLELFLRLLFSTLVDADFLDTETHFSADKDRHR